MYYYIALLYCKPKNISQNWLFKLPKQWRGTEVIAPNNCIDRMAYYWI